MLKWSNHQFCHPISFEIWSIDCISYFVELGTQNSFRIKFVWTNLKMATKIAHWIHNRKLPRFDNRPARLYQNTLADFGTILRNISILRIRNGKLYSQESDSKLWKYFKDWIQRNENLNWLLLRCSKRKKRTWTSTSIRRN